MNLGLHVCSQIPQTCLHQVFLPPTPLLSLNSLLKVFSPTFRMMQRPTFLPFCGFTVLSVLSGLSMQLSVEKMESGGLIGGLWVQVWKSRDHFCQQSMGHI